MSKSSSITPSRLANNPRASADAWGKYAHIVLMAYQSHPAPFTYIPTSHAATSVASKIRDAIRGKLAFDYPFSINNDLLAAWWEEVVVIPDGDKVKIGPREAFKSKEKVVGLSEKQDVYSFVSLTTNEINAFELLLNFGRIKGPVMVREPESSLTPTSPFPNVERIFRPDGSLVLL